MKIAFIEHKGHKNKKKHHLKFVRSNTIKSNHECTMVQDELSLTIPAAKVITSLVQKTILPFF